MSSLDLLFQERLLRLEKFSNRLAICSEDFYLTYAEVDQLSNKFAQFFIKQNYQIISVSLEKNIYWPVLLLAIFKAGKTYLPLSELWPDQRKKLVRKLMRPDIIIDEDNFHSCLSIAGLETGQCDFPDFNGDQYAYIIFTSGSTGAPKGVKITYNNLSSFVGAILGVIIPAENVNFLSLTNICFDISILEVLLPIFLGGLLVIPKNNFKDQPNYLKQLIIRHDINMMQATPGIWQMLNRSEWCPAVNFTALCGGETVSLALINELVLKGCTVYHLYGPTEATIWSSVDIITKSIKTVTLGRAISHVEMLLFEFDVSQEITQVDRKGEICITGRGLFPGYVNSDDDHSKFFSYDGKRFYRTGDQAKINDDNQFVFMGRRDTQVKINGYRVEIGEIEAILNSHHSVAQGLAFKVIRGQVAQLCALIKPSRLSFFEDEISNIREYMAERLPSYMMPDQIDIIDEFPRDQNGKVRRDLIIEGHEILNQHDSELLERGLGEQKKVLHIVKRYYRGDFFDALNKRLLNSLIVLEILHEINKTFQANVSITKFLEISNIDQLLVELNVCKKRNKYKYSKLANYVSPYQEQIILADLATPSQVTAYNIGMVSRISIKYGANFIKKQVESLINNWDFFSKNYIIKDNNFDVITNSGKVNVLLINKLSTDPDAVLLDKDGLINAFFKKRFDLKKDKLIRFLLIQCAKNISILVTVVHHAVADGRSCVLLCNAMADILQNKHSSIADNIDVDSIFYHDTKSLMVKWCDSHEFFRPLRLVDRLVDRLGSDNDDYRCNVVSKQIIKSDGLYSSLQAVSRLFHSSNFAVLTAIWCLVFHRFSGMDAFSIGVPYTLRLGHELSERVDCLTNILPFNFKLSSTLSEFFHGCQTELDQGWEYAPLPLMDIYRHYNVCSSEGLRVVVVGEEVLPDLESSCLQMKSSYLQNKDQKYDLCVIIEQNEHVIDIKLEYAEALFNSWYIENLMNYFCALLDCLSDVSAIKSTSQLLDMADENCYASHFNQAKRFSSSEYPRDMTIGQAFKIAAIQYPQNAALISKEMKLTYEQLNDFTDEIAKCIYSLTKSRLRIAILMDRHPYVLCLMLAVIKMGGVYTYVDSSFPEERIKLLLEMFDADLIICDLQKEITKNNNVVQLDVLLETLTNKDIDLSSMKCDATQEAYCFFTSGTTDIPKAVTGSHRNVLRLVKEVDYMNVSPIDVWSQISGLSFDGCLLEIWGAWLNGATLAFLDEQDKSSPDRIKKFFESNQVSKTFLATDFFHSLVNEKNRLFENCKNLEIFVGGSQLSGKVVNKVFYQKAHPKRIINFYGPTECSCGVLTHSICGVVDHDRLPIGLPMSNVKALILDENMQICPLGVPGEIFIGGDAVTLGYLDDQEKTNLYFVNLPCHQKETYYKTGDMARYIEGSVIEWLARNDDIIKWNGIRISPAEIKSALSSINIIQECAVGIDETGDQQQYLALVVLAATAPLHWLQIVKSALIKKLPGYVVPSKIISVKCLPLTSNGKIDFKSPHLELSESGFLSEQKNIKQSLISIWKELLGNNNFTVDQKFFDVGGNSLMLLSMTARINQLYNVDISAGELTDFTTVRLMSEYLKSKVISVPLHKIQPISKGDRHCDKIAIIAVSSRLPGVDNLNQFWDKLVVGDELIERFSHSQLLTMGVSPEKLDSAAYIPSSSFIADQALFDYQAFNMSHVQAAAIDPQQRLMLETVWESLEISGYCADSYSKKIGIFCGMSMSSYKDGSSNSDISYYPRQLHRKYIDNNKGFLATRAAYFFNLTGPAINIDTACSSGLVALAQACDSIRSGHCEIAVVGASSLILPHEFGYCYEQNYTYSRDGHCRSFDADATGIVPGSAVVSVVCKSFTAAQRDGDNILGVIDGYAVNNDGYQKLNYLAPSVQGQYECIVSALHAAKLSPNDIDYVETHGTGTQLGDAQELMALYKAYGNRSDKLMIGSIKSNVGHTDAAAGLVGLIKVLGILDKKIIPPTLHFNKFSECNGDITNSFECVATAMQWQENGNIALSSFGIGGTNTHFILSRYNSDSDKNINVTSHTQMVILSAYTKTALTAYKKRLFDFLCNEKVSLIDLAYTLQVGRKQLPHRFCVICNSTEQLCQALVSIDCLVVYDDTSDWLDLAQSWIAGETINFAELEKPFDGRRIPLPTYPFEKSICWDALDSSYPYYSNSIEKKHLPNSGDIVAKELREIWSALLVKGSVISNDINFFDIGGDSVAALELIYQIEAKFHIKMTVDDVLMHNTLDKQIALVSKHATNIKLDDITSNLVVLRESKSLQNRKKIVFIHPIGGTAFCFMRILNYIPEEYDIYAYQDPLICGKYQQYASYQDMLDPYLEVFLNTFDRSCDVILMGYSAGGILGLELARIIRQEGYKQSKLVMFDTWSAVPENITTENQFRNIINRQIDVLKISDYSDFKNNEKLWRDILWNRMEIMKKYSPDYFDIDLVLFKADTLCNEYRTLSNYHGANAITNGWQQFVNNVQVVLLPFAHEKIFANDNINTTGQYLKTVIESFSNTVVETI